jgi:hypothetical protein
MEAVRTLKKDNSVSGEGCRWKGPQNGGCKQRVALASGLLAHAEEGQQCVGCAAILCWVLGMQQCSCKQRAAPPGGLLAHAEDGQQYVG